MKEENNLGTNDISCSGKSNSSPVQSQGASNCQNVPSAPEDRGNQAANWEREFMGTREELYQGLQNEQHHTKEQNHAEPGEPHDRPRSETIMFDLNSTPEKENDDLDITDQGLNLSLNLTNPRPQRNHPYQPHTYIMHCHSSGTGTGGECHDETCISARGTARTPEEGSWTMHDTSSTSIDPMVGNPTHARGQP